MKKILHRYLFNEIWPTFVVTLLVFVFIMLATRMLSITEWIIDRGFHPGQAVKLTLYVLPNIFLFALPAASLLAVLVAYLRLSSDNEIIALNAAGISLFQTLPPVLVVCISSYIIASLIAFYGVPWGNKSLKDMLLTIVESNADVNIKERIFYSPFDDVVFYTNHINPKEKTMKDVFVMDRRDKSVTNTIIAKEGRVIKQPKLRTVRLHFKDGHLFMVDKDLETARTMKFKSYEVVIDLRDIASYLELRKKSPKEMYIRELIRELIRSRQGEKHYYNLVISLMEKITIPLAVFLMGFIGAPLGAQLRLRGRSFGIFVGLIVFVIYYICLMGVRSLGESGSLTPYAGLWIPNIFLATCCLFLLGRTVSGTFVSFKR